jgi:hypothetical protein
MGANTARSVGSLACVDEQGRVYAVLRLFYTRGLPLIGSLSTGGASRPPPNSMSALWLKARRRRRRPFDTRWN